MCHGTLTFLHLKQRDIDFLVCSIMGQELFSARLFLGELLSRDISVAIHSHH